jgi:hypothetical protein
MKRIVEAVGKFFRWLFGGDAAEAYTRAVERAAPYLEAAWELVQVAARAVPNRTFDEIVQLCAKYGVPVLWRSEAPWDALRQFAFAVLRSRFPNASKAALNLAVELAVNRLKVQ